MHKKDEQTIWGDCLSLIKTKIPAESFRTWFEPIIAYKYAPHTLTIQVPSQFFYEWLESKYPHLLREAIHYAIGPEGRLTYQILEKQPSKPATPSKEKKTAKKISLPQKRVPLNPLYTFENFVIWDQNELCQAASVAIAQNPGKIAFNPLMIHAPVGLGKTHLMHAIMHETKKKKQDRPFFYITAEDFTAELIKNIRHNTVSDFVATYFTLDMLLIDDIQFLKGKEKTQEIFFNIFNHLYQNGKQIVMSSDRAPNDLVGFERRLLSRFKAGLTTPMGKPDLEDRIALIKAKLEQSNFTLAEPFILRIAETITSSVREIEGALNSLIAYASLNKKPMGSKIVDQVLHGIAEESHVPIFDLKYLQKAVAEHYKVSLEALRSRTRTRELATARHVAMYLARLFMPDATLQAIGYSFGRRDHSTVSYGIRSIEGLRTSDPQLRKSIEKIKKTIQRKIASQQN